MYKVLKDCRCSTDGVSVLSLKKGDEADLSIEAVKILGNSVKLIEEKPVRTTKKATGK